MRNERKSIAAPLIAITAIVAALAYPLSMGQIGSLMLQGYLTRQTYQAVYLPVIFSAHHLGCLDLLNSYLALGE